MDMNTVKTDATKAYGFWKSAAAWVAAHPATTLALAIAVIVAALVI